ncbi:MAG: ADP-glyceromanno-heptose 6-epimerase, partial [Candidatus Zixiibacteriota bacterium]
EDGSFDLKPEVIFHQGACTDTTEYDGRYMMDNNFTFSKELLGFALAHGIPFIYASSAAVYGANRSSGVDPENERPLNVYGYSKLVFDQYVRRRLPEVQSTVVGLRYFNVYGPRETEKGKMASMVYQLYRQIMDTGRAKLFEGTDGFGNGEQRRDFVSVDDLVKVNLFISQREPYRGIVNVGTGQSRSFNAVARGLFEVLGKAEAIEYIPFDKSLTGKYQSFTEADLAALREAGYDNNFVSLEDGIRRAVAEWSSRSR